MTRIEQLELEAVDLLKRYEPMDGYHLAFSGGKDSICCWKLCDLAGVKYRAVYSICTVESKETLPFIKKFYPKTEFDRPGTSLYKLIAKEGLPTRKIRYCCRILKEYSGKGQFVITGIRHQESKNRQSRKKVEIDTRKSMDGKRYLHPIIEWTSDDVWEFITKYKLPTPDIYTDCQTARGGCIGCPMNSRSRIDLENNHRYKNAYIKAIRKSMDNGKYKNFDDEYDVYNWWVSKLSVKNYKAGKRQLKLNL